MNLGPLKKRHVITSFQKDALVAEVERLSALPNEDEIDAAATAIMQRIEGPLSYTYATLAEVALTAAHGVRVELGGKSVAMQTTLERIRDLPCDAPRLAADVLDALGRR